MLVVCTDIYKQRFDKRKGGAGYEGHIITGEIISEVGLNKFIPVLGTGNWSSAVPTALSGIHGVDLSADSPDEYRRLVKHLHGLSDIPTVGPRPDWLNSRSESSDGPFLTKQAHVLDPSEYWQQRKRVRDTAIIEMIWSKPRWCIWIRPTEFKRARFQNVEQCREFMQSSYVPIQGCLSYPAVSTDAFEIGDEWIAGETSHSAKNGPSRLERWSLFRSGQFVHNRAFDENLQIGDRIHVLEILDAVTGAFEFAARMAQRGVLSREATITFDLYRVDGRALTWPEDISGNRNAVGPNCWCQNRDFGVQRTMGCDEIEARRREFALEVTLEIYRNFGWLDPPEQRLADEQNRRFGTVRETQN